VKTILWIWQGRKFFIPVFYFKIREAKKHFQFGMYNVGDSLIGFIQFNSDNIIIGGMLGVKILGYYTIAYQLAVFPITKLNPIILQVAYPILAKIKENDANLKGAYLKILDFISYCNLPLLAGLFITAESVVPLFYGPGWEQTIFLIKIFVINSLFYSLSQPLFTIAFTKGKPNLLFYLNLITLAIKIPLIYVFGYYWQLTGIAVAFALTTFINFLINFYIVRLLIGSFITEFLRNFIRPLGFCLLMIGAIAAYKNSIGYEGVVNTIIEVIIGGMIYLFLTFKYKISFAEIRSYRKAL
jgi:PST family polysaccharide transporter/lipopolysaccharide exporter